MTSHTITLLTLDTGRQIASNSFFAGMQDVGAAWDWISRRVAEEFDCLPDDVGCDECPEGSEVPGDLVTVNGEAVARIQHGHFC